MYKLASVRDYTGIIAGHIVAIGPNLKALSARPPAKPVRGPKPPRPPKALSARPRPPKLSHGQIHTARTGTYGHAAGLNVPNYGRRPISPLKLPAPAPRVPPKRSQPLCGPPAAAAAAGL